ncbi:MAG TPA: hypothetical protein VI932_02205, partial [Bacteroidota bacterium]|nr:hypothetical protein [Bacteroidota bacterium]
MKLTIPAFILTIASVGIFLTAPGATAGHDGGKDQHALSKTAVNYAKHAVQGFDMRLWISNQMTIGLEAFDGAFIPAGLEPRYGLEYPAGSGVEHVYGAGPMIGGIVDGSRRVSQGYGDGGKYFRPDPAHPLRELIWRTSVRDSVSEPNRRGCDDDGDALVDEDDLDGLDNDGDWNSGADDVGADGIGDIIETGCKGGYDAAINPDPAFDNYQRGAIDQCHPDAGGNLRRKDDPDAYTEDNGIPDHGEPHVDEDYAALSDNDLYCSARDDNDVAAGHFPMGIKLVQKCYAWAGNYANAVIPFDYYFINMSNRMIRDVYVGFFADLDVGPANALEYYNRNYSCYFDSLMTAYVHNPIDRGSTPIGIAAINTPKPLSELKFIYQWFNFTTRTIPGWDDSTLYSWMSGEPFPGNLVATCESPTTPSDTRFLFSFGPFEEFAPGETLKISVALVAGEGILDGPNNLKENAQQAIKLFKRGFVQPVVPPSPSLRHTEGFQSVTLEWGGNVGPINPLETWDDSNKLAERYPPDHWRRINPPCRDDGAPSGCSSGHACDSTGNARGGRTFEGYRLYRSEDPGDEPEQSSFTMIREFDIGGDGYGFDLGLDSVYVDSPLVRGKRYWYAVTSFGIPDVAVVDRVTPGGGVTRDTLYSTSPESPFVGNRIRVDLGFSASNRPGEVLVVPNPYRVDHDYTYENGGWEGRGRDWDETKRMVKFIHLPEKCVIRIFSLTGDHIATLDYEAPADQPDRGELDWNLLSESNRALASGVYVYTVESRFGRQIGKFVLIR